MFLCIPNSLLYTSSLCFHPTVCYLTAVCLSIQPFGHDHHVFVYAQQSVMYSQSLFLHGILFFTSNLCFYPNVYLQAVIVATQLHFFTSCICFYRTSY